MGHARAGTSVLSHRENHHTQNSHDSSLGTFLRDGGRGPASLWQQASHLQTDNPLGTRTVPSQPRGEGAPEAAFRTAERAHTLCTRGTDRYALAQTGSPAGSFCKDGEGLQAPSSFSALLGATLTPWRGQEKVAKQSLSLRRCRLAGDIWDSDACRSSGRKRVSACSHAPPCVSVCADSCGPHVCTCVQISTLACVSAFPLV